ncbi:MAG: hypothetical protein Q9175_004223 [Cornicularia normoerica]
MFLYLSSAADATRVFEMSPRRPHLRNRKRIKAPRRFEDADIITSSPHQESNEESEESSELEEEIYKSPKPKKPIAKLRAYHGKVIEFNANLPPAAFPTFDHPDYVHNGGDVPIDLESHLSGLQTRDARPAASEAINPDSLGRGCHREEIDLTGKQPAMTSATADFTRRGSQSVMQTSITVQRQPRASMPSNIYGESTDNGPRNPIWASNMARMEEAGRMSSLDRNILEMETSDEEDAAARPAKIARPAKMARPGEITRAASSPEIPDWDDLTVAHKLDLADAIGELYPDPADPFQVMHRLRLSVPQKKELAELLIQRQDQAATEEANQRRLQEQTKDILLQGGHLSQSTFHQMVEENLWGTINESDPPQTNLMELKKARAYLRYCGFNPALADSSWESSNAASGTKPRPAPDKSKASISSIAAHTPPSPPEGSFSRRPALCTPSQQASYPADPRLGLMQQHTQGALHQHRPTPAHALIAQHSPAAPLSKVPVQSYRVAPGIQSGDVRSRHQGTAHKPRPTLPALRVEPNGSTGPDLHAINNTLLEARVASSTLPTPQEEHPLHAGLYSLASKGLPTTRRNQKAQGGGNPSIGASAPQGTGSVVVENGDSVNKKKRKKGAT